MCVADFSSWWRQKKNPVQDKSGGKLDVFFLLIEVFKFGQISHRRAFSGRVCQGTLYRWHVNVLLLIVWLALAVAGGFHSPLGPRTAAAPKSKLTWTGAQMRGLLFYGQNKILKLEVQAQRHLCSFFFFGLFFLLQTREKVPRWRLWWWALALDMMKISIIKYTCSRVTRQSSVIVLLTLLFHQLCSKRGKKDSFVSLFVLKNK